MQDATNTKHGIKKYWDKTVFTSCRSTMDLTIIARITSQENRPRLFRIWKNHCKSRLSFRSRIL